jgi:phosphopantetheinyl transferase (holo-ACP synthase)
MSNREASKKALEKYLNNFFKLQGIEIPPSNNRKELTRQATQKFTKEINEAIKEQRRINRVTKKYENEIQKFFK